MSKRTQEQISYAATLRVSHLAQIEALLEPGLTDKERVHKFLDAIEDSIQDHIILTNSLLYEGESPARRCWFTGQFPLSLFANLPSCYCPVIEVARKRKTFKGIPSSVPDDWSPTRETLEAFSRVQIEARCVPQA